MRLYAGTLTSAKLSPMVVGSYIDITVVVPELGQAIEMRGTDTIENLSETYGFTIVAADHWDVTPMLNRPCTIMRETVHGSDVYTFRGYN